MATLRLPSGSLTTFLIVECRHEPRCLEIGYYTEEYEPGYAEPERVLNEGPSVNNPAPIEREGPSKVFDLPGVPYSCEGTHAVALVDALLRQPRDTVTDQSGQEVVRLKKATIPGRYHPEGVLVYGLLLPHANTIVVKAPDGRVVVREHELGAEEEPNFKGPNTPRHCGAR